MILIDLSPLNSVLYCIYCALLFVGSLYVIPANGLSRNNRRIIVNRMISVLVATIFCAFPLYYFSDVRFIICRFVSFIHFYSILLD
jgi:hypothetical protein